MTNAEYASALRKIADFYEATPEMPTVGGLMMFFYERETFINAVRALASGGMVNKSADQGNAAPSYYRAERDFGGVEIKLLIDRHSVCRLIRPAEYECPDSLLEHAAEFTKAEA